MNEDLNPTDPDLSWQECMDLLDRLPSFPAQDRVATIERLVRNPSPMIRERALRTGAAVVPDDRLVTYLRSDADDIVRNAGMEMLKMRGAKGLPLSVRLLRDEDPDVVLQAVLALGHLRDLRALEPLRASLTHTSPNIVAAAIEAVGRLGDDRAVPDLLPFLEADLWLQMAAVQALGDLRSSRALKHLSELLPDLMVGPMAAEALARVGGLKAFKALIDHWLLFGEDGDTETTLGLLAHVVEGLSKAPEPQPELLESLVGCLQSEDTEIRASAARCLLALGPTDLDDAALDELAEGQADASIVPACLDLRRDLASTLVAKGGKSRAWGFLLAAKSPRSVPVDVVVQALTTGLPSADTLRPAALALERIQSPRIAEALVDQFVAAESERGSVLVPLLATHRDYLEEVVSQRSDLDSDSRLVLLAQFGTEGEKVTEGILELDEDRRFAVLERIIDIEDIARRLPWRDWLGRDPDKYAPLAARIAARYGMADLLPTLRQLLIDQPTPEVVRAMGEFGDRESVPTLGEILNSDANPLIPIVLESLGRIGGPEARAAIREVIFNGKCEPRLGLRALSLCAIEEDDAVFRGAVGHADWYVRLTCAEVLGRFTRPENLAALSQLAADPVEIVSKQALSSLEA